jgi:DNA-binding transcriptional MerR regulator
MPVSMPAGYDSSGLALTLASTSSVGPEEVGGVRIGEIAERALRHYEATGLLRARRDANGYRDYGEDDVRLVTEIRSLLAIGFTLEETRPFVDCLRAGHETGDACPDSVAVYRRKLADVDAYLDRLNEIRAQLTDALARHPQPRCDLTTPEVQP